MRRPPPRSSWGKARDQVTAGRLKDADKIGVPAGKVIDRYKVAKHFILDISPGCLAWRRDLPPSAPRPPWTAFTSSAPPSRPANWTPPPPSPPTTLPRVERDFRIIKTGDLDLRPIHHWLQDRVRGHVLICMLAAYLAATSARTLLVPLENRIRSVTCRSSVRQAACEYSLIRPPRMGFRRICCVSMPVTVARGASGSSSGTRWAMPWCGRVVL